MMQIGQKVPDFEEEAYVNGEFRKVKLSSYRGKWVIVFFYPLDFTFVCPTEINSFAQRHKDFEKLNAVIIGCSTDSVHSHKAWFQKDLPDVDFPVIGDTAHRLVSLFGVLKEDQGIAFRGTFIIDPEGVLRAATINDLKVGRNVEETLRTLQAFQTGELCPVEWKPGMQTLGK